MRALPFPFLFDRLLLVVVALLIGGCSTARYTVDDGRVIDPQVLTNIQAFGDAEQAIRPAIVRSARVLDAQCDKQWELPFSVATSYALPENDRVAWVRIAKVDERLTVLASAIAPSLSPGDKVAEIDGYHRDNTEKMGLALSEARDRGQPFPVKTAGGKIVTVKPFQVCRGYTRFSPPATPQLQDYHWLLSFHPTDLGQLPITEDEALWIVLWTQGLSEEGGARMKTYHYGKQILGGVYQIATVVSGLKGVAVAAQVAADAAQRVAVSQLSDIVRKQLMQEATAAVRARMQQTLAERARAFTQQEAISQMQIAAANRGALQGVAWVAGTVFDQADQWAYARLPKYDADPLAPFTLHQKLIEAGLSRNAFVFDAERLKTISEAAGRGGHVDDALAVLRGVDPGKIVLDLNDMPLASVRKLGDIYADDGGGNAPAGLVEALLELPLESRTR